MPRDDLRKGRYSAAGHAYHVTTIIEGREPIFSDLMLGRILVRGMKRLHDNGDVQSLAFVVMPDHLHWLFVLGDRLTLSEVIRSLKGSTSLQLGRVMGRRGPLWQRAFYDHAVHKDEDVRQIARYIITNPLRRRLVKNVGDYTLWDSVWL